MWSKKYKNIENQYLMFYGRRRKKREIDLKKQQPSVCSLRG
jgi:hypothetical protein